MLVSEIIQRNRIKLGVFKSIPVRSQSYFIMERITWALYAIMYINLAGHFVNNRN